MFTGGLQVPNSLVLAIGGTGGNRTLVQFTVMTLRVQIYETPHISARGRAPDTIGSGAVFWLQDSKNFIAMADNAICFLAFISMLIFTLQFPFNCIMPSL